MAAETELERIVIRLIGDATSYQQMLKESEEATQQAAKTAETSGKKIEAVGQSLQKFGKGMMVAGAAMSAAITAPITAMGALSVKAFSVQEAAEIRLGAAVKRNKEATSGLFNEYKKFASELQSVTVIGDEATLGMLQQAEGLGVTGEAAKRAAKNAIALAADQGMAAKSAMRYAVALEQGDTMMLNRYIPALKGIEDQAERVAKAQEILASMFGTAEAEAKTFRGRIQQLKNSFGDLQEEFGKVIADALKPVVKWFKQIVSWFQALSPEVKKVIVIVSALLAAIGPLVAGLGALLFMLGSAAAGFSTLVAIIGGILSPVGLVVAAVSALVVGIGAAVAILIGPNGFKTAWESAFNFGKNFFGKVLGFFNNFRENLKILRDWFTENWQGIFSDAGTMTRVFAKNSLENLKVFFHTGIELVTFWGTRLIKLWKTVFGVKLPAFAKHGLKIAGRELANWAITVVEAMGGIFSKDAVTRATSASNLIAAFLDDIDDGVKTGLSSKGFLEGTRDILAKGFEELKSPLEGFEASVKGPNLNFERAVAEEMDEAVQEGKNAIGEVVIPLRFSTVEATEVGTFKDLELLAKTQEIAEQRARAKAAAAVDPAGELRTGPTPRQAQQEANDIAGEMLTELKAIREQGDERAQKAEQDPVAVADEEILGL